MFIIERHKMYVNKLSRTRQTGFDKKIYGYDIETYGQKNKFLCASLYYDDNNKWAFNSKEEVLNFFKNRRILRDSMIAATNLLFDFMGTFFDEKEELGFNLLFRGSELITAKTWIKGKVFYPNRTLSNGGHSLTFIDTMNYASLSVEKLGKIINSQKLIKPEFLGQKPKTKTEWEILKEYNMRDSEISKKALDFLYKSFIHFGATPKPTIAATAMSLFKNKYLYNDYFVHKVDDLQEEFKSYCGGRCEAFSRGLIKNYNYYDFNSLYPYVMTKDYPDPNTMRLTFKNDISYIMDYEGISEVTIEAPFMKYPLLPYRTELKLLFPIGIFRAFYTHIELRKSLELGYKVRKIHKIYYFKAKIAPFRDYVNDLYDLRIKYKKDKNPMEYVVKILMNSLYGKFGQKFWDRDNWQPFNLTLEELHKLDDFERFGKYIRIKKAIQRPASFCFPIWASYITSYARLHLYDAIVKSKPVYCDTDSLLTKKDFEQSDKLGSLKLEMPVKYGYVVKPKMYAIVDNDNNEYVKVKGIGERLCMENFQEFLYDPSRAYKKFVKFKEAMRRGLIPNEIIDITKKLTLEDNKREWYKLFDPVSFESSDPIELYV